MSNSPSVTRPKADDAPDGTSIRRAINRQTKVIRTRGKRWSARAEACFLETLAATANVSAAAEAAGFSTTAIYKRRMNEPGFAARWAQALDVGYARLECLVIETGTSTLEGAPLAGDHPIPRATFAEVLNLLRLHRFEARGGRPQRYDWRAREPDIEEVRAEVLRRLEAMGRTRIF
ncbi:MAG TPA: hypothetical protein VHG29_13690 [Novosphingobium sp.]|nr:hypothetical protein [Novosphingobium sp.]